MFSIKASLIRLVLAVFFVRSSQAQTNITIAEAEAADASAKQWLQRQNIIGRSGGSACANDNFFFVSARANDKCVGACDEGWEKHGNHCYFWGIKRPFKAWTAAEEFCQEEGGHLASVGSNETMDYIILGIRRRGFGNGHKFWLGGNDIAKEGVWKWTDCTPWELTFWKRGQPDNFGGYSHCVVFDVNNQWNDYPCTYSTYDVRFLCSKRICNNKGELITTKPTTPATNANSNAAKDTGARLEMGFIVLAATFLRLLF